jgi:drug/metabolite transporter (DMT)-like permease
MRLALPSALLVVAMFLWGSSFVALKAAFALSDAWWIIWARMVVATLIGLALFPLFPRISLRAQDFPLLLVMAGFEPCLYFIFETLALQYTSAAQAGAITALLPLFIGCAAWIFLREKLEWPFFVGVVIAFGGAVWLSLASAPSIHAVRPWLGNSFEALAMLSAAGYVMAVKKLSLHYQAWHLVLIQNGIGMVFFTPFAMRNPSTRDILFSEDIPWASILYLGAAVSLGAFLCYNLALRYMPASRAAVFTYLIPVFAAGMSVIYLGEELAVSQFVAIGMILCGVIVAEAWPKRPVEANSVQP